MPIIVLNMGGEMIYILNQRLQAQNVPLDKARKVLGDVIRTMYTPMFLEELFKPQEIYTMASTKQIFDKLAHSSIMRLNKTSMDKLFDLMTMGVKYQLISCRSPHQYLQVTLNHLDILAEMVKTEGVTDLIQVAISKAIELYTKLSNGNWLLLEQVLLQFFQGKKIKVSLFLQRNLQTLQGSLVLNNKGKLPFRTELPGEIRYFEGKEYIRSDEFLSDLRNECTVSETILEPNWTMGMNIYLKESETLQTRSDDSIIGSPTSVKKGVPLIELATEASSSIQLATRAFARNLELTGPHSGLCSDAVPKAPLSAPRSPAKYSTHLSAKAELTLLSDLLGVTTARRGDKRSEDRLFKINLFPNEAFGQEKQSSGDSKASSLVYESGGITIDIDAASGAKSMHSYMEELDWDEEEEERGSEYAADAKGTGGGHHGANYGTDDDDDLLALMDSAK